MLANSSLKATYVKNGNVMIQLKNNFWQWAVASCFSQYIST